MSNENWAKDFAIAMAGLTESIQSHAAATNNLAEAIHRHAELKMSDAEEDFEDEVTSFDMSGRPVRVG